MPLIKDEISFFFSLCSAIINSIVARENEVPSFASMHEHAQTEIWYSWVSRDVINFTGGQRGQLQIDTLSSD